MKEFVLKLNHVHNVHPHLTGKERLGRRWLIQWYTPEFKLVNLENNKGKEFFVGIDTGFRININKWVTECGFVLLGFGVGVSRKTDTMLEKDLEVLESFDKSRGA